MIIVGTILGRVALVAQRPIVVKLSRELSVGRSVCRSVCPVHCGKTADRIRRLDGSRDEADGGVWRSVHGKGYFWGTFGVRHL